MNQEIEPGAPQEDLRKLEIQALQEIYGGKESEPKEPGESGSISFMEHYLIGSTPLEVIGGAALPNLAAGLVSSMSPDNGHIDEQALEKINQKRGEINQQPEDRRLCFPFSLDLPYLVLEYKPLTREDVLAAQPRATFRVVGAKDTIDGVTDVPIPENVEELIMQKMRSSQEKATRELKKRYGLA